MTNLREKKLQQIANDIPLLEIEGYQGNDADLLIVGWGGTYGHLYATMKMMNEQGMKVALAHFRFISPLPKNTAEVLRSYKNIVVAEENLGQFAGYLRMKIEGLHLHQFNQLKGQPFVVKELVEAFTKLVED